MRSWGVLVLLLAGCAGPAAPTLDAPGDVSLDLTCPIALACDQRVAGPNVNEFSIAVDPTDPKTAIITANDYEAGRMPVGPTTLKMHTLWGSIWTTHDGGVSWHHQYVEGRFTEHSPLWGQEYVGDLVVTFGPDGTAYIAGIAYASTGTPHHKLWVMSSPDGDTWSTPVIVDQSITGLEFQDKPALLVTQDQRLVMVWNHRAGPVPRDPMALSAPDMKWATSDDGGTTWDVGAFDDAGNGISAALAQAPDGTIHAVYRTYQPLAIMHRSSPDGQSWSDEVEVVPVSSSSTATPNADYRSFVLPDLAITPDGTLHSIIADKDEDGFGKVLVSTSRGGVTWNTTRIDTGPEPRGRFFAAIDNDGDTLVATWLDRRDDEQDASYALWAATSTGDGWHEQRLSGDSSPPGEAFFIGDYLEVDLMAGQVYVAWPDLRNGQTELFATHLSLPDLDGPLTA